LFFFSFIFFSLSLNYVFVGLLIKEREKIWKALGKNGDPPRLVIQKCEDHILNLMSLDYETWLATNSNPRLLLGKKKKHRATDVVQFLIAKVFFL
jgi:hypothetical protein